MRCRDGREFENGLLCGSSKRCVKAVEGQSCLSYYWCPQGYRCSKKTQEGTTGLVAPADRFPSVSRALTCVAATDCYKDDACINGICLPLRLGSAGSNNLPCRKWVYRGGLAVEGTEGVQCRDSYGCANGMTCHNSVCSSSKPGDRCLGDYNCPQSSRCSEWRCILPPLRRGDVCSTSSQCRDGLLCKPFGYIATNEFSTGAVCSNP